MISSRCARSLASVIGGRISSLYDFKLTSLHSLAQIPAIVRRMRESFRKNTSRLDGSHLDESHEPSRLITMLSITNNQPPDEVVRAGEILQTHGFFLDRTISQCDNRDLVDRYVFAQNRFSIVIDCRNGKYRIRFLAPPSSRMMFISNGDSWELAPGSLEDGVKKLFPRPEEQQNVDSNAPQIME